MSHKSVANMLDDLGRGYDTRVFEWKDKLHPVKVCMHTKVHS